MTEKFVFVVIGQYRTSGLSVLGVYDNIELAKEGFLDDLDEDIDDKTASEYANELFRRSCSSADVVGGAFYVFEKITITT